METIVRVRRIAILGCCLGLAVIGGCAQAGSLFSPTFLQAFGVSQQAASLPGEAPALLVTVENKTSRHVEFLFSWRDSNDEVQSRNGGVDAGQPNGTMLVCPIKEVTLGDIGNLGATGAIVLLGSGTAADAFIEVEPFARLLEEGVHYDCGDEVKFTIEPSTATLSGYQIFARVTHSGLQSSGDPNSSGG